MFKMLSLNLYCVPSQTIPDPLYNKYDLKNPLRSTFKNFYEDKERTNLKAQEKINSVRESSKNWSSLLFSLFFLVLLKKLQRCQYVSRKISKLVNRKTPALPTLNADHFQYNEIFWYPEKISAITVLKIHKIRNTWKEERGKN